MILHRLPCLQPLKLLLKQPDSRQLVNEKLCPLYVQVSVVTARGHIPIVWFFLFILSLRRTRLIICFYLIFSFASLSYTIKGATVLSFDLWCTSNHHHGRARRRNGEKAHLLCLLEEPFHGVA